MPSSLKDILGLYGGDMYDPYEMAAMRQRNSVRPRGGRQEGELTRVLEDVLPRALDINSQLNPIDLVSRAARATTGDLLFPMERLAKYRMERDAPPEPKYEKDQARFTSGQMAGSPRSFDLPEQGNSALRFLLGLSPAARKQLMDHFAKRSEEISRAVDPERVGD